VALAETQEKREARGKGNALPAAAAARLAPPKKEAKEAKARLLNSTETLALWVKAARTPRVAEVEAAASTAAAAAAAPVITPPAAAAAARTSSRQAAKRKSPRSGKNRR
jgi:hypothetical protein